MEEQSILLIGLLGWLIFFTLIYITVPATNFDSKGLAILIPATSLLFCLLALYDFDWSLEEPNYQYHIPLLPDYGISLSFGLDGVSLCFLLLTAFIIPLCTYAAIEATGTPESRKQFVLYILYTEIFLVIAFTVTNLLFFYVFFESVLIPMYVMIGEWGSRSRKVKAAFYLFIYTLAGSFFLLYGLYQVYEIVGSLEYEDILNYNFTVSDQIFLFPFFFIPFAIKIPMFPFHIWLPEAHVEAPTIASVILASLLLKLGGYGFIRFTITMFPAGCSYFDQFITALAVVSVIYGSLLSVRQSDMKRIIAYSSIAHMNLAVLGIFSLTHQGLDGAIYLMMTHGVVSAGLFFCVGVLYDRYHTRSVKHYSGLAQVMPLFCTFLFLFTLGNLGFPGTGNFIGELLLVTGLWDRNSFVMVFTGIALVSSAIYSLWLFNRTAFGTLKIKIDNIKFYADMNRREFGILLVLAIIMLALGLYSVGVTNLTLIAIKKILISIITKK